jgi:hypothetical protein
VKETKKLEKARQLIGEVGAVTFNQYHLTQIDNLIDEITELIKDVEKGPSRTDYVETLGSIIDEEKGEGLTARVDVLHRIMENIEQGIWELPEEEVKENG